MGAHGPRVDSQWLRAPGLLPASPGPRLAGRPGLRCRWAGGSKPRSEEGGLTLTVCGAATSRPCLEETFPRGPGCLSSLRGAPGRRGAPRRRAE